MFCIFNVAGLNESMLFRFRSILPISFGAPMESPCFYQEPNFIHPSGVPSRFLLGRFGHGNGNSLKVHPSSWRLRSHKVGQQKESVGCPIPNISKWCSGLSLCNQPSGTQKFLVMRMQHNAAASISQTPVMNS